MNVNSFQDREYVNSCQVCESMPSMDQAWTKHGPSMDQDFQIHGEPILMQSVISVNYSKFTAYQAYKAKK